MTYTGPNNLQTKFDAGKAEVIILLFAESTCHLFFAIWAIINNFLFTIISKKLKKKKHTN